MRNSKPLLIGTCILILLTAACRILPRSNLVADPFQAPNTMPEVTATQPVSQTTEKIVGENTSYLDIPYIDNESIDHKLHTLDIYIPEGAENLPVIVFIHGGGWVGGDKSSSAGEKPQFFNRMGFIFTSINYRLSPQVIHPAHVQDVASALAWIQSNISTYSGNPEQIFIIGHSAGAHLAALVATDETYLQAHGLNLDFIDGVVCLDGGGYDIPLAMESEGKIKFNLYTSAFGWNMADWIKASPIHHVKQGKAITPFLLIHAGQREASLLQAEKFSIFLASNDVYVEVYHAIEKNHGSLNNDLGKVGDEPTDVILHFINALLQ